MSKKVMKLGLQWYRLGSGGIEGGLYAKHKLKYSTFLNQEGCIFDYELYVNQSKRAKPKNSF